MVKAIAFFLALLPALLFAQKEKGVNPITSKSGQKPLGITRAVVIGISDYQEAGIPDLRYADKDAEAFAQYLRSPGGGELDKDHLQVLVNEGATAGNVVASLYWLLEASKEGDQAIIYFSGHGDVERKFMGQPGFLLCWDAPPSAYMAGGVVELSMFRAIISTLSLVNEARVLVISDACHAGKLAGENIGGSQATTANLANQFAKEIKILSCQPNEFSLEGKQWGGGRGVFSYHLVDGLYGFADKNTDETVTLSEIDRYLEDKVTTEAAPQSQIPMVIGNKAVRMSSVNSKLLAQLQQYKAGKLAIFSPTEGKGLEDNVLAKVDSTIRQKYLAFKKALRDKQYFEPAGTCADDLYASLSLEPGLAPMHGFMKRNYAAALQDDAQQVINRILFRPNAETWIWISPGKVRQTYGSYPRMLERAASILGPEHYMHNILLARKAFFEGLVLNLQRLTFKDLKLGKIAVKKFKESLALEPNAPHTEFWLAMSYFFQMGEPDSAYYYVDRAIEGSPKWVIPRAGKLRFLSEERKIDQARIVMNEMLAIDSTNAYAANQIGYFYLYQGNFQEAVNILEWYGQNDSLGIFAIGPLCAVLGIMGKKAEAVEICNKYISRDSSLAFPYYFLGSMYFFVGEYDNAARFLKKTIEMDPSMVWCRGVLGDALIVQGRFAEAEIVLTENIANDSTYMPLVNALGGVYQATKRLDLAEAQFKRAIQLDGAFMAPYYNLAAVYSQLQRFQSALNYLDLAIQKGMRDYNYINQDGDLKPLRELPEFKILMQKYFPGKTKE